MNDTNNEKTSCVVRKLICNLFFFFCATESAIGSTGDREALSHELRCEALRIAVPPESFDGFFNGRIPTASLVKMADQILEWQISAVDDQAKKAALQDTRKQLLTMQSRVNVDTFRAANPLTPLQGISERVEIVNKGDVLGEGGMCSVRFGTIVDSEGKTHRVAIKRAKVEAGKRGLAIEGKIGNDLAYAYTTADDETSLLNMQGLPLVVVPYLRGDRVIQ
jgi:hypothetical protein